MSVWSTARGSLAAKTASVKCVIVNINDLWH
jgi:hypothetical protein